MLSSDRERGWLTGVLGLSVVAAGALVTCCGPGDADRDAGAGPPRDASADAGRPTRDGGADAAARDAGRDGGPSLWQPIEGLPPACRYVEVAADPEAIVGSLAFEACPDAEGCEQLVVDWAAPGSTRLALSEGSYADGLGHFGFYRGSDPAGWGWYVLARTDGSVRAVVRKRSDIRCIVGWQAIEPEMGVLSLTEGTPGGGVGSSYLYRLDSTRPGSPAELIAELSSSLLGQNAPGKTFVGDGFLASFIVPRGDVLRVGLDGSTEWLTDSSQNGPVLDAAAGDAVFVRHEYPDWTLSVSSAGQPLRPFVDGGTDFDAAYVRTDGRDLVWLQLYGRGLPGEYERIELWTSPFTSDPAALAPRRVVELPGSYLDYLAFGYGHVIDWVGGVLNVYTLNGTHAGDIHPPDVSEFRGTMGIFTTPDAFAFSPRYGREHTTLRIQRYDALSPP